MSFVCTEYVVNVCRPWRTISFGLGKACFVFIHPCISWESHLVFCSRSTWFDMVHAGYVTHFLPSIDALVAQGTGVWSEIRKHAWRAINHSVMGFRSIVICLCIVNEPGKKTWLLFRGAYTFCSPIRTAESGSSGKFNRQDFSHIKFMRFDGDIGIKRRILRHVDSFVAEVVMHDLKKWSGKRFLLPCFKSLKILGCWKTKLRDKYM